MVQRVIVRSDLVRISKPGIDVNTAAEKDLLLSLGARNAQIIQRGYLPMPQGTPVANNPGISTYNFTIFFPGQQSRPDLWASILTSANADTSRVLTQFPPTQRVTFGTSSATIQFVGSDGSLAGSPSYGGLIYTLFRKRIDS